jgi:hypothetical protein
MLLPVGNTKACAAHYAPMTATKITRLDPDDAPEEQPSACPRHYPRDLALMNYLLQDMRSLIRLSTMGARVLTPHERLEWTVHGLHRRTIVCDPERIVLPATVHVVGFFSDRADVDRTPLFDAEDSLLSELENHPGMLGYSSMELIDNYWTNLVIHTDPADRETWRGAAVHRRAVDEVAPVVYNSVRIHKGCLIDGVTGSETIRIESTSYWDYRSTPHWHAVRDLPGGFQAGAFPSAQLGEPATGLAFDAPTPPG